MRVGSNVGLVGHADGIRVGRGDGSSVGILVGDSDVG